MWLIPRSTSWLFVPVSECSTKGSTPGCATSAPELALWVTSSGKPQLCPPSWVGWKKRAWSRRLFGPETLKLSDGGNGMALWIALQRASPASPGQPPAGATERPTSAGSGPTSLGQFQKSNRHFAGSKTCGDLFLEAGSSSSLLTLPASGSMLNGVLSPQPPLALPTSATESSSWPTATAQDGDSSGGSEPRNRTLTDAIQVWRSPCATEAKRGVKQHPTPKDGEHSLVTQIENWATPRAEDAECSGMRHERGVADTLTAQTNLWATPVAASGRGGAEDPAKKEARQRANGGGTSDLLIQAQQWPSPNVPNGGRTTNTSNYREDGSKQQAELSAVAVKWPTPSATPDNTQNNSNSHGPTSLGEAIKLWPTPMTADDGDKVTPASHQGGLTISARQWPTIANRDYRTPNAKPFSERGGGVKGEQLPNFIASRFLPQVLETSSGEKSSLSVRALRRRLNPAFVCWLMGWPLWWTRAEPTSFGAQETALWRLRLDARLCSLLGGR